MNDEMFIKLANYFSVFTLGLRALEGWVGAHIVFLTFAMALTFYVINLVLTIKRDKRERIRMERNDLLNKQLLEQAVNGKKSEDK